ncbi:hypothetical protein DPEC_G00054260 [Dallia pectoralis]|uniref:Uncharacterized protein n=1 Tax=Dallia pectoralis TaxID=75939 RepID=A0ACC2H543_DALPE|nr:hypothetical protein DPEC_G00054260 [Dallia pectoralis]
MSNHCLIFRSTFEENILLWNTSNPSSENFTLPGGLRDRLNLDQGRFSINDVTQSDSGQYKMECWTEADIGEYQCSVVKYEGCVSVTKTFLMKRDPFGINSTFYRVYSSLMTCALLGMICVLITVNLKTRRRYQASKKTRRTVDQTERQMSSRVEEEREESEEETAE